MEWNNKTFSVTKNKLTFSKLEMDFFLIKIVALSKITCQYNFIVSVHLFYLVCQDH